MSRLPKLSRDKAAPEHWSLVGNHGKSEKYLEGLSANVMERIWGFHSETELEREMAAGMKECVDKCDRQVKRNTDECVSECMEDLRKRKMS